MKTQICRFSIGQYWLTAVFAALLPLTAVASEQRSGSGIVMVDIPAGSFVMGSCVPPRRLPVRMQAETPACSPVDGEAYHTEGPPHQVEVAAFQLAKTPVTLKQFERFIREKRRDDLLTPYFRQYNNRGGDAPVIMVSWGDAQDFIAWLNETDGPGWRLPSEAEWEYACRAGQRQRYCGSDDADAVAWHDGNSAGDQQPVRRKAANAWGLHDMSGNVWEWTQDCWHESHHGAPSAATAWTQACSDSGKVIRGGSWGSPAGFSRASSRRQLAPDSMATEVGFRLARSR